MQVLQTRLRNRRNQCYLHALITCLRGLSQAARGRIGTVGVALQTFSQQEEIDVLQSEMWAPYLRGWRRPTQQHDVTELLHHLSPCLQGHTMQGEWAEHRPTYAHPHRLVDHSPMQPHISLHIGRNRELQGIINSWSRDHHCLLTAAPQLLIVSLIRFAYSNQHARKLRH